jgi:serine protease Do
VVGVNSAIASNTGFYQGYGFAIPVNLARRVMEDLVEYGAVRRPRLGVTITNVTPEDAEYYGLPSVSGAKVNEVAEGTPAFEAGIRPQDVIVSVEGKPVGYSGQLQQRIAEFRPGDRVTVTLYRDGERRQVEARLGEAPISEAAARPEPAEPAMEERLGIEVAPLTPELAQGFGYDEADGVVITGVEPASPAQRRGLGRGLRIVAINDQPVSEPADVGRILSDVAGGDVVNFQVELPGGQQQFINIRMPAN